MSDALKKLDEIEARLKAATPGPWDYVLAHRVFVQQETGEVVTAAEEDVPPCVADAALIAHAPADLALLARLVRSVAEQACEGASEGLPDEVWSCETHLAACDPATWCTSCRIRRELSEAVRCQ